MSEDRRLPFWQRSWVNVASLLIGALGTLVGIIGYVQSIEYREPMLSVVTPRLLIIDRGRVSSSNIKVLDSSNKEIVSDLVGVQFYFWNNGKGSIKSDNILQNLTIELSDPQAVILDYKITKLSREVIGATLSPVKSRKTNAVDVLFKILEHKDGFAGQIIYEGDPEAKLVISGAIEGVSAIQTITSLEDKSIPNPLDSVPFIIKLPFALVFLISGFGVFVVSIGLLQSYGNFSYPHINKILYKISSDKWWNGVIRYLSYLTDFGLGFIIMILAIILLFTGLAFVFNFLPLGYTIPETIRTL
ncbi:MAG: hypothetical protein U0350_08185 [Caldilineaceae bacterium]